MPLTGTTDALVCGGVLHRFLNGYAGYLFQNIIVYAKHGPVRQWRKLYGVLNNKTHTVKLFASCRDEILSPEIQKNVSRSRSFDSPILLNSELEKLEAKSIESEKLKRQSLFDTCVGEYVMDSTTLIYDVTGNIDGRSNVFYFSQPHLKSIDSRSHSTDLTRKVGDVVIEDDFYLSTSSLDDKNAWIEALIDSCHGGFKMIHQPELSISAPQNDQSDILFYPTLELIVQYTGSGNKNALVENGNILKPSMIESAPAVSFGNCFINETDKFSLIMLDMDPVKHMFSSRSESGDNLRTGSTAGRAYLHWCIMSFSGSDLSTGNEVCSSSLCRVIREFEIFFPF